MPRPRNGATSPNAIAQPNIAPVRWSNGGRFGIVSESAPRPLSESRPRKISAPRPAASRPGRSTSPSIAPPRPEASSSRKAPSSGEPSSELIAAKLPVAAMTFATVGLRVARRQADGQDAEAAAHRDQRRLGAEHRAERQRRERGEQHAGELDRAAARRPP